MPKAFVENYRKVDTPKANSNRVARAWWVIIAPFSFPIPSESVSGCQGRRTYMRLHEVFTKVRPRNKDQTADESANELTLFSVGHGNNLQIKWWATLLFATRWQYSTQKMSKCWAMLQAGSRNTRRDGVRVLGDILKTRQGSMQKRDWGYSKLGSVAIQ